MCLTSVERTTKNLEDRDCFLDRRRRVGYVVVYRRVEREGVYYSSLSYKKGARYYIGEERDSRSCPNSGRPIHSASWSRYPQGFHIFSSLRVAESYRGFFSHLGTAIVKVSYRGLYAEGTQSTVEGTVRIARWRTILGEVKER